MTGSILFPQTRPLPGVPHGRRRRGQQRPAHHPRQEDGRQQRQRPRGPGRGGGRALQHAGRGPHANGRADRQGVRDRQDGLVAVQGTEGLRLLTGVRGEAVQGLWLLRGVHGEALSCSRSIFSERGL